jgi:hypothetical protein
MAKITISGSWDSIPEGQVYEAQAKTTAGRTVSRVKVILGNEQPFEAIHGDAGKAEVEKAAKDLCDRLVPPSER